MRKAGSIVALVAGIFGVIAALLTLLAGSVASASADSRATTVLTFGWGGVIASFLVIILGALTLNTPRRLPAILLAVVSVVGMFTGGTLVALFMVLALIGSILALFQRPTIQRQL